MKKYINKLFEWLGYVPKDRYKFYKQVYINGVNISKALKEETCEYCLIDVQTGYLVTAYSEKVGKHREVKYFSNKEDKEYAKLCAEELCEMLNQKI